MLELLYASNIVITGSWLPYKTYRKAGLSYVEIDDFQMLSSKLNAILDNFQNEKAIADKNKYYIRDYFLNDNDVKKWSKILSQH
jgi:hypothetical protein